MPTGMRIQTPDTDADGDGDADGGDESDTDAPLNCGDGNVSFPELCDDENTDDGDGCGSSCRAVVIV